MEHIEADGAVLNRAMEKWVGTAVLCLAGRSWWTRWRRKRWLRWLQNHHTNDVQNAMANSAFM